MRQPRPAIQRSHCLTAGLIILLGGCSQPAKQMFPELQEPLAWPPAPATARIRYVGELRTSDDLKAAKTWLQGFADVVLGEEEPEPLHGPRAVMTSGGGRWLWVADPGGRCLHLFDLLERDYLKIDHAGDAPLLTPVGLCSGPGDSVYVCDSESESIHRFSPNSEPWDESLTLPIEIERPVAMEFDRSTGELFVVDVMAHDIKVLDSHGEITRTVGRRGDSPGEFNFPCDIARDGDLFWVADTGNYRVQGMTSAGESVVIVGMSGDVPGRMAMPKSVAVDSDGHLYVVDTRFENVQVFDRSGQLLIFFGEEGSGPGEFWLPGGIFIDPEDRIWICDAYNRRLQVFEYCKP